MKSLSHPSDEQLSDFSLGKLSAELVREMDRHLAECAECQSKSLRPDARSSPVNSNVRGAEIGSASQAAQRDMPTGAAEIRLKLAEAPPRLVAGHELIRELARGGLGVIYLARHPVLKNLRAIKYPLTCDNVTWETMLVRFRREVEIVGSLHNDHVIRGYDAGADLDGPYLVMDYLEGESFSELLKRNPRLNYPEACELVRQAALGLQAASERGLVHRDVKPSNLVLARANSGARVVVIDWGLARLASRYSGLNPETVEGPTQTGACLGSPDFIAPEQIQNAKAVDSRADVYSLGATLYCMLAGQPPFHGRTILNKLVGHAHETFPSLQLLRSDIPGILLAVLQKMVEKDPENRYATPGDVAIALKPFCCPESELRSLLNGDLGIPPTPPGPDPHPRWLRWVIWSTATSAVLLLVAVMFALALPGSKPRSSSQDVSGVLGDGPASPVSMAGHPGRCSSLAFTPDGQLAISESGGGGIYVWDLKKRSLEKAELHGFGRPEKNQKSSGVVAISPDGSYIVAAAKLPPLDYMNVLSLYDQNTCKLLKKDFAIFTGSMGRAIAFSPGRHKLLATEDGPGLLLGGSKIVVIEVLTGKTWRAFSSNSAPINSFAFSPRDTDFLAIAGSERSIRVRDLEHDRQVREFKGHAAAVDQIAFSGDGERLFSASNGDGTLRVWNNDKLAGEVLGKELMKIDVGKVAGTMTCVAFWPAGRAFTGHADGSVVLWDLVAGTELKRFAHPGTEVTAAAISPDGHHALSALSDNLVYLYRLPPPPAKP